MNRLFRFLTTCAIGVALATLSIAWAQNYTTVNFPGATATLLVGGPNPEGTSVGIEITAGVQHGIVVTAEGRFTVIDPPGSTLTAPNYITEENLVVGNFEDSHQVNHGFVLYRGRYTTFNVPGALATVLSGANSAGEMTGFTCSTDPTCEAPPYESFTVSPRGEITRFNPFDAPSSFASGLNPQGTVVGTYTDSSGVTHGYEFEHGSFTSSDFPGSILTFNGGINAEGDIVGFYTDTSNVTRSFLRRHGDYTSFDPPGSTYSNAGGINASGVIAGFYLDSANVAHGYIRTPRR